MIIISFHGADKRLMVMKKMEGRGRKTKASEPTQTSHCGRRWRLFDDQNLQCYVVSSFLWLLRFGRLKNK
jgi:hypothetical protein